jgi:hypothetical protein
MDDEQQNFLDDWPPPYEFRRSLRRAPRVPRAQGLVPWPLLFSGVVLPVICFLISFPVRPDWQSGQLGAYAQLLLAHKSSTPLYPLLIFSMASLVLLFWQPGRYVGSFWVRWGIISGVVLAAEYWLLFQAAFPEPGAPRQLIFSAFAWLVPWAAWRITGRLRRAGHRRLPEGLVILAIASAIFWLGPAIFVSLWCATTWAFATYLAIALPLLRRRAFARLRFNLAALAGFIFAHAR